MLYKRAEQIGPVAQWAQDYIVNPFIDTFIPQDSRAAARAHYAANRNLWNVGIAGAGALGAVGLANMAANAFSNNGGNGRGPNIVINNGGGGGGGWGSWLLPLGLIGGGLWAWNKYGSRLSQYFDDRMEVAKKNNDADRTGAEAKQIFYGTGKKVATKLDRALSYVYHSWAPGVKAFVDDPSMLAKGIQRTTSKMVPEYISSGQLGNDVMGWWNKDRIAAYGKPVDRFGPEVEQLWRERYARQHGGDANSPVVHSAWRRQVRKVKANIAERQAAEASTPQPGRLEQKGKSNKPAVEPVAAGGYEQIDYPPPSPPEEVRMPEATVDLSN